LNALVNSKLRTTKPGKRQSLEPPAIKLARWRGREKGRSIAALLILLLLLVGLLNLPGNLTATRASKPYQATLTEWPIPTQASGITALTLDQSGSCCWFVEYYANELGHFNPATNTFQEWAIPTAGANPYDLAVTSNPSSPPLWGTELGTNKIFAFSPTTETFHEYSLPYPDTGVGYISIEPSGPQVRVWFTGTIGNINGEIIYDATSGNATLYEDHFPSAAGGGAYGVYAQSNSVWFAGFSALVRWDRATQQYSIWPLPVHGSAIGRFLTLDSSGEAWYTQGTQNTTSSDNFIGVLRNNGIIQEWKLPNQGADPQKISINPQTLQPWIAERSLAASNGTIGVLTNSSAANLVPTASTTYPSGGTPTVLSSTTTTIEPTENTVTPTVKAVIGSARKQFTEFAVGASAPEAIVTDSRGNVWFNEPGTNKIAELSNFTPDFALSASPTSMTLPQGSSETTSIIASAISGYQGSITINASNLPRGVTIPNNPDTLTIAAGTRNASIQLSIDVDVNATPGTGTIIFEGDDGVTAHTLSIPLTITNSSAGSPAKSQCLIAIATYGSGLNREISFLRSFRLNVLRTETGSNFLAIFNTWYYSFSPNIANYIGTHSNTREVMRLSLYPLIGALALSSGVYTILSSCPESAVLVAGLLASCLIGALYIAVPLLVIKRLFRVSLRLSTRLSVSSTLGGLAALLVGLKLNSNGLMMIASLTIVLFTIWGSGAFTANLISHLISSERTSRAKTVMRFVRGGLLPRSWPSQIKRWYSS